MLRTAVPRHHSSCTLCFSTDPHPCTLPPRLKAFLVCDTRHVYRNEQQAAIYPSTTSRHARSSQVLCPAHRKRSRDTHRIPVRTQKQTLYGTSCLPHLHNQCLKRKSYQRVVHLLPETICVSRLHIKARVALVHVGHLNGHVQLPGWLPIRPRLCHRGSLPSIKQRLSRRKIVSRSLALDRAKRRRSKPMARPTKP